MTGQISSHNNIGWSKAHTDAYNAYIKASDNYAKEAADVDRVKTKAANCEATYNFNNNLASKTSLDLSSKNTSITSLQGEITNLENQKNSTSNSSMQSAIQSTITQKNNEIAKLREQAAQLKRDLNKYQSQAKTNLDEAQRLRREDQVKEQNEANQAKTAMNNAKATLVAEEKKDIQAQASSKGLEGEMAANKDNRKFYESRISAAKSEIAGFGAEIDRYKASIASLQSDLSSCKAEMNKLDDPALKACYERTMQDILNTIQEAEQKITEAENNIKKSEVLIQDSETSITNIDASIRDVRAINGLRDSSNFTAIDNLTDVSAAFKQVEDAKSFNAEVNNDLNNALNAKTSNAQAFGSERASLNSKLSELTDLMGKVPDSKKSAISQQITEIRNKLNEMDKTERELDKKIGELQTQKAESQSNLQKAEANYKEAVKIAERENEVLKSAYADAALDLRYQVTGKNTNTFNGCIATNMHDSELKALNNTAGDINNSQKILSDETIDKNSKEYADALTQQNRAMNGIFESKNQYLNNVENTTQAVAEVRNTVDSVVTMGLNYIPGVGTALSAGYNAGMNLVKNYEDSMADGVMSKSEFKDVGTGLAKDLTSSAVNVASGGALSKFTGKIPKLGGKFAPNAQEVLLNGVNSLGANFITSFVSGNSDLDSDTKSMLQQLGSDLKGISPNICVDVLKAAFKSVA